MNDEDASADSELGFSEAQAQALIKIRDLLKEHFENSVVAVESEVVQMSTDRATVAYYHGSKPAAVGLGHMIVNRFGMQL